MPKDDAVRDIADSMFGEAADGKTPFVLNVIHHHHEHHTQSDQMSPLDMILQLKAMQAIAESFRNTPLLAADTTVEQLQLTGRTVDPPIRVVSNDITGEYEVFDSSASGAIKQTPVYDPVYRGKTYFEVWQLLFTPDWKNRARGLNIRTPFAIIEMLREETGSTYLTVYSAKPLFSKSMYGSNGVKKQFVPFGWDKAPYFVSLMQEAKYRNGDLKFFYYVEELELDDKESGSTVLSNDFPKTEIWESISIFSYKPSHVYTNFQRNVFRVEPSEDGFTISRE